MRYRESRLVSVVNAIGTRAASAGLGFVLNIALGRLLGPAGLGTYYLYISWTNLLGSLGGLGLPTLTLRTASVLIADGQSKEAQKLWRQALLTTAISTGGLALLAHTVRSGLALFLWNDAGLGYIISLAAWSAMPFVLLTLSGLTLAAQNHPNLSLGLRFGLVPALLLAFAGYFDFTDTPLSSTSAIVAYTILLALAAILTGAFVQLVFASRQTKNVSTTYGSVHLKTMMPQAFRFWLIALLNQATASAPFLLLPYFGNQEEIGLFGAANRLVSLAVPILLALSSIYAPLFASAYAHRNGTELRSLLRQTQVYSIVIYLPLLALFLSQSSWVLGLYGKQFTAATPHLQILALGQLINSATGLVTNLNLMTENEQFEVNANVLALISMATISILAARAHGAIGVTVAVAFSLGLKNTLSYIKALRTLRTLGESQ